MTATEIVDWWTSMPIYFSWLITALLSVSGDANSDKPTEKWAPFILRAELLEAPNSRARFVAHVDPAQALDLFDRRDRQEAHEPYCETLLDAATYQCCGERTSPGSVLSEMPMFSRVFPNTRSNWAAAFSHAALAMTSVVCA